MAKPREIQKMVKVFGLSFITLQEDLKIATVARFWDGSGVEFAKVDADGRSGGILALWDPGKLKKQSLIKEQNYLVVRVQIVGMGVEVVIFFISWLGMDGLTKAVNNSLAINHVPSHKGEVLAAKLKAVRNEIKAWRHQAKEEEERVYNGDVEKIKNLDRISECRQLSDEDLDEIIIRQWESNCEIDICQKSRVKWLKDADENNANFHGVVKSHRAKKRLNGLWIDGEWKMDPTMVKNYVREKSPGPDGLTLIS